MTSPAIAAQVLAANRRFYDALEALDAGAMEACWASSPAPACVHPGGPWQRGWEEVAAGWDAIMSATGYIEFEIADAVVSIVDPVAWVTCVERITSAVGEGGQTAVAEVAATNLFVLDGTGWHLALHHASPVIRPALVDE
ncbi:nuclear transport factor 2 family protein [Miltoncostaea oceani]|uniref:nuclear transport factor 2 family protein n=1 Tax=Miltoncostaea oceani TaxID=2843216 RepID=UPI001C3D5ED9|nr:nuclear transport factor 2 family protein [Miltoncostaea oceani]